MKDDFKIEWTAEFMPLCFYSCMALDIHIILALPTLCTYIECTTYLCCCRDSLHLLILALKGEGCGFECYVVSPTDGSIGIVFCSHHPLVLMFFFVFFLSFMSILIFNYVKFPFLWLELKRWNVSVKLFVKIRDKHSRINCLFFINNQDNQVLVISHFTKFGPVK